MPCVFLAGYKPKRFVNGHEQPILPLLDSLWARPPQTHVLLCCVAKSGACASQERLRFMVVQENGATKGRCNSQGLQL